MLCYNLNPGQVRYKENIAQLQEEVALMGLFHHPNIVRCLGASQHEGHINIFMEWMAGIYVGSYICWSCDLCRGC